MKIERDQHNEVTVIVLDTGIKLDLHDPRESLSIDTPVRMWDVTVAHGRLKLDGHDVEELIDEHNKLHMWDKNVIRNEEDPTVRELREFCAGATRYRPPIKVTVNGIVIEVPHGTTVKDAIDIAGAVEAGARARTEVPL